VHRIRSCVVSISDMKKRVAFTGDKAVICLMQRMDVGTNIKESVFVI